MERLARLERAVSVAVGAFVCIVGLTVMIAWHAGIASVIQFVSTFTPMQYNTALCFFLLGLALLFGSIGKGNRSLLLACASTTILLSLVTFAQYVFDVNLSIDELFVKAPPFPNVSHPGRMAPNTALCLVLAGVALLFSEWSRKGIRSWVVSTSAGLIGGIAAVSIFGYLGNVPEAYQWKGLTGMAFHTGVTFVILSAALMVRALAQSWGERPEIPSWLPISIAMTGISVSGILSQAIALNEGQQIKKTFQERLSRASALVELGYREEKSALLRFAKRWEVGGKAYLGFWKSDTEQYFENFPNLRCFLLLDGHRDVVDESFSPRFRRRPGDREVGAAIGKALDQADGSTPSIMNETELSESGVLFTLVIPVNKRGWVLARFDARTLFETLLPSQASETGSIVASHQGVEIYRSGPLDEAAYSWTQVTPLGIDQAGWQLALLPTKIAVERLQTNSRWNVFAVGTSLSLFLAAFFHFWRKRREDAATLRLQTTELQLLASTLEQQVANQTRQIQDESERRRENEERLRLIFEGSPSAMAIFDLDMRFLLVSDNWLTTYGLGNQSLIGHNLYEAFPNLSERWKAVHRRCLAGGIERKREDRIERSDGKEVWIHWEIRPWRNSSGQVGGIVIFSEDITDRKLAERALSASEKQLRLITDALPVLISYIDRDLKYQFQNAAYERWFGKPRAEILGKAMPEVIGESAVETLRPHLEKVLSGEAVCFEAVTPYASGTRTIQASYIPDFDVRNQVKGFYVLVTDVSERKKAEEALKRSESNFRSLAEAMPQIVWTADAHGTVTYFNQRWHSLAPNSLGSARDWPTLAHPDDRSSARDIWNSCIENGTPLELECRFRDRDSGAYRWYLARAVAVLTDDTKACQWFGTFTDFHEKKLLEEGLEAKVIERTAELTERESQLDLALKSSTIGAWEWDIATGRLTWDEAMHRVFGTTPATFDTTYENFISLIASADRERVAKSVQTAVETGTDFDEEYRVSAPNGSKRIIQARGRSYRNGSHKMIGLCWDVTSRRETEQQALSSERRFRMVFESAPDPMVIADINGIIICVNHQTENTFGYERGELEGKTIEELVPLPLRSHHAALRRNYVKKPNVRAMGVGLELSARKKDGTLLPVEISLSPSPGPGHQGRPGELFVVAAIRDVSQKKEKESQLRTLAAVVESSNDFIGICAPDMSPIFLNEAGREMVGLTTAEAVQQTKMLDYFHPEDRAFIETTAIPILKSQGRWSGEVRFHHFKTGEPIHTIWNAFVIRDANGKEMAWASVSPNLNRLKESEEKMRSALLEKEILLREIHHRVKNNLNVISSLLDLQLRSIADPSLAEVFRESQNRVRSMALIHEKLYQSKNISRVDFEEYVRDLVRSLFHSYGIDETRFGLKVDIHDLSFEIDTAIPCSLIINELVSNALKHAFRHRDTGEVIVDVHPNPDPVDGAFEMVVSDDGIGMPKDFQIEKSKSLGLRLVKTLTRQLGGNVRISADHGTKFTIHFGTSVHRRNGDQHVH